LAAVGAHSGVLEEYLGRFSDVPGVLGGSNELVQTSSQGAKKKPKVGGGFALYVNSGPDRNSSWARDLGTSVAQKAL